ncbi:YbaB/EbfC family nucleoid-associated protein [bacterium]|nr:YbaB/EbfC family nucleoid-associated protein [bacterium]
MFEKLRQFKELKRIQEKIKKEKIEVERQGTKVVLGGNLEVIEIKLNPELDKTTQEKVLKECLNEAISQIQQKTVGEIFKMIS